MPGPGERSQPAPLLRGLAGGALMGLANLVPGVSGGTMLLAANVYPQCIEAVAKVTTLKPDRASVALLAAVAGAAGVVILLLAGTMQGLVINHRWAMYSLFLGSTLGGLPVLWALIGTPDKRMWLGAAIGFGAMVATALAPESQRAAADSSAGMLFLAGFGAFGAMLLPGLSGGYLLLLTGQYVPILGAVDAVAGALAEASGPNWASLIDSVVFLAPFAAGALAALVGVSSLVRHALQRFRSATLGVLVGLLAGALIGLWPFEAGAPPGLPQIAAALGLALAGFVLTSSIGRFGNREA